MMSSLTPSTCGHSVFLDALGCKTDQQPEHTVIVATRLNCFLSDKLTSFDVFLLGCCIMVGFEAVGFEVVGFEVVGFAAIGLTMSLAVKLKL